MFSLTKMVHDTGKVVVLYPGFYVLHILVYIKKKGLYGSNIIKKRGYLPHYIYGEKIKSHFTNKGVGVLCEIHGEIDNVPLHVFATKKENYFMILMSTYGTNERVEEEKLWKIG